MVDNVFSNIPQFSVSASGVAIVLYAIQIYCDFSGYSDMANGVTRLLGYRPVPNFNHPYFSQNIAVFWRRWHISLSYWFRDYVYIPLGGSRCGNMTVYRNLFLTMLLCGLWHGAAWTFVIWGGSHGLALVIHRMWKNGRIQKSSWFQAVWQPLRYVATFYFVCAAWILFRSESMADSFIMLERFLGFGNGGNGNLSPYWLLFGLFLIIEYAAVVFFRNRKHKQFLLPGWAYAVFIGALTSVLLFFLPLEEKPFIYFQF